MSNLRLSYLQKVGGGSFVQAHPPPTQKSGGGGIHPPIPPPGIYASGSHSTYTSGIVRVTFFTHTHANTHTHEQILQIYV